MWGTSSSAWQQLELSERRYVTVVEDDGRGPSEATSTALMSPEASISVWRRPITSVGSWFERKAEDQEDQASILRVPRKSVGGIDFGPHGWSAGVVYAAHPKQSHVYRPIANFYEDLLLQKISELERLINALGAREYKISHVKKGDRTLSTKLEGLPVVGRSSLFGGGVNSKSTDLIERTWSGTSDGHAPWVPTGLVWLESEAEWRNLIESRMTGSRKMFAFTVRQDEEYGLDARLAATIKALKLDIGGQYRSTQHVEFAVSGSF